MSAASESEERELMATIGTVGTCTCTSTSKQTQHIIIDNINFLDDSMEKLYRQSAKQTLITSFINDSLKMMTYYIACGGIVTKLIGFLVFALTLQAATISMFNVIRNSASDIALSIRDKQFECNCVCNQPSIATTNAMMQNYTNMQTVQNYTNMQTVQNYTTTVREFINETIKN